MTLEICSGQCGNSVRDFRAAARRCHMDITIVLRSIIEQILISDCYLERLSTWSKLPSCKSLASYIVRGF